MSHVFISYSRQDQDFVQLIEEDLLIHEHAVWRDRSELKAGEEWLKAIDEALRQSYALVVVLSSSSIQSKWVDYEIEHALKNNIPIVPIQKELCDYPTKIEHLQAVDFITINDVEGFELIRSYRDAFGELVHAVNQARPVIRFMAELNSRDPNVREMMATRLGELGDPVAVESLITALSDIDPDVRFAAAEALGKLTMDVAIKPLIARLDDEDPDVRSAAAEALAAIGSDEATNPIAAHIDHSDRFFRAAVVRALGVLKADAYTQQIIELLRTDPISDVRNAAIDALRSIDNSAAQRALKRARVVLK